MRKFIRTWPRGDRSPSFLETFTHIRTSRVLPQPSLASGATTSIINTKHYHSHLNTLCYLPPLKYALLLSQLDSPFTDTLPAQQLLRDASGTTKILTSVATSHKKPSRKQLWPRYLYSTHSPFKLHLDRHKRFQQRLLRPRRRSKGFWRIL